MSISLDCWSKNEHNASANRKVRTHRSILMQSAALSVKCLGVFPITRIYMQNDDGIVILFKITRILLKRKENFRSGHGNFQRNLNLFKLIWCVCINFAHKKTIEKSQLLRFNHKIAPKMFTVSIVGTSKFNIYYRWFGSYIELRLIKNMLTLC